MSGEGANGGGGQHLRSSRCWPLPALFSRPPAVFVLPPPFPSTPHLSPYVCLSVCVYGVVPLVVVPASFSCPRLTVVHPCHRGPGASRAVAASPRLADCDSCFPPPPTSPPPSAPVFLSCRCLSSTPFFSPSARPKRVRKHTAAYVARAQRRDRGGTVRRRGGNATWHQSSRTRESARHTSEHATPKTNTEHKSWGSPHAHTPGQTC